MKHTKIIITNQSNIPNNLYNYDGTLSFDLPSDFDISETENTETLSIENLISLSFALSAELPLTPKNIAIFNCLRFKKFGLLMQVGSRFLNYKFGSIAKKSNTLSIELENNNPLSLLNDVYLKDLDLGVFDFSIANFMSHYQQPISDVNVCFPIVDFGGGFVSNNIPLSKFRPLFRESYLIKLAFAKVGYNVDSQLFTLYDNNVFSYICGSFLDSEILRKFSLKVATISDIASYNNAIQQLDLPLSGQLNDSGNITVTDNYSISVDCFDNGINALRPDGYFAGVTITQLSGRYRLESLLFLKVNPSIAGNFAAIITVQLVKNNSIVVSENILEFDNQEFAPYKLNGGEFSCVATDTLVLRVFVQNAFGLNLSDDITLGEASNFHIVPLEIFFSDGLKENLNKYVGNNYKAIDLLKGFFHKYNAVLDIDYIERHAYIYPTFSAGTGTYGSQYGSGYNTNAIGYYSNIAKNLTERQVKGSETIESDKNKKARYIELCYKYDADTSKLLTRFGEKRIDFGAGQNVEEKTQKYENPFYAVTQTVTNNNLFPNEEIGRMSNNEGSGVSHNITPRSILISRIPSDFIYQINGQNFLGYFVTAYCKLNKSYSGVNISNNLLYGTTDYDLYSLFYFYYFAKKYNKNKISALFALDINDIKALSMRDKYVIYFSGKPINVRIVSKKDMKYVSEVLQLIEFEQE